LFGNREILWLAVWEVRPRRSASARTYP
jgi:hypothetical protein